MSNWKIISFLVSFVLLAFFLAATPWSVALEGEPPEGESTGSNLEPEPEPAMAPLSPATNNENTNNGSIQQQISEISISEVNFSSLTTGSSLPVTGWAWSSNIGWIKFDHEKANPVTMDSTGNLSGYAWSSNIGWINFSPDGPYPANDESPHGARLNMSTGAVTGWARAVSQIGKNDGWDGWIRFDHDKNNPVTVNLTTGQADGFAWGSTVLGWIDMSPSYSGPIPLCDPNTQNCDPNCDPTAVNSNCGNVVCNPATSVCFPCQNCGDSDETYELTVNVFDNKTDGEDEGLTTQYVDGNDTPKTKSCTASDNYCNYTVQVKAGTIVIITSSNSSPDSWLGACDNQTGNQCSFIKSNQPQTAGARFGSSGDEVDLLFNVEVCTNILGNQVICTLRIDCSIGGTNQNECASMSTFNNPVYSNAIRLKNNINTKIKWSADPSNITNGETKITILFCSNIVDVSSCSVSPTFSGDAFIRARLDKRGITTNIDVNVHGSTLDNSMSSSEKVRVTYIEARTTQK